jgi:hypothetical protein
MCKAILFGVSLWLFAAALPAADLVVHEWGTVTTIHDAAGKPAGGLNSIDAADVLPDFVHRYEPETTRFDPKLALAKVPLIPGRPDVTMRLETPVIYFHPPPGAKYEQPFDITVRFRGGVLNEFYPDATASVELDFERIQNKMASGAISKVWNGEVLNDFVVGELKWQGVRLHDTVVAPLTNSPIWLAPREVQAASVFVPSVGEGERYVFYRGVAHLDALLQTKLSRGAVRLSAPAQLVWLEALSISIPNVWLAEVRADGVIAFREHASISLLKDKPGAEVGTIKRFGGSDYTPEGAKLLRASLKKALIKNGLFADEAEAMLNTWKASYFEKPGLRVFYIAPRQWIDYFLPLKLSVPARVNRVIVGRIDLAP